MFQARRHIPIWIPIVFASVCISVAVILLIMLPVRGKEIQLPASETFGILAIDIDDDGLQSGFHVSQKGVYVLSVEENSQAETAGIQSGDRIVSLNGTEPSSTSDFVSLCSVDTSKPVCIIIERDGSEQLTVDLTHNSQ